MQNENAVETEKIEEAFFSARGRLRMLRGKIDTYLVEEHPGPIEGFVSAEVKNAKYMREVVNMCITYLDRYEDRKEYNEQFEMATVRLFELAGGRS